jgi:hypothetical protein
VALSTAAHNRRVTHSYVMHYPEHAPSEQDPHYRDFEAYRRATHAQARCAFAVEIGSTAECAGGLELHHSHVEFSLQNGIDLGVLEAHYPGISDPAQVGAWVESAANLQWLCAGHHRGHGGVHSAAASDYEASMFVRGLITGAPLAVEEGGAG